MNRSLSYLSTNSFYGLIIIILPDLSSLTATSNLSLFTWGMKSQLKGENGSLTTIIRSQFKISNILSVLSIETVHIRSWSFDKLTPVIRPLWALKCLMNSIKWYTFFQNLMWPSIDIVII